MNSTAVQCVIPVGWFGVVAVQVTVDGIGFSPTTLPFTLTPTCAPDPSCSNHGWCFSGSCQCDFLWQGDSCNTGIPTPLPTPPPSLSSLSLPLSLPPSLSLSFAPLFLCLLTLLSPALYLPLFNAVPNVNVTEGTSYTVTPTLAQPYTQPVTFAVNGPEGMTINRYSID